MLVLALAGCSASNLAVFDRPQVESDLLGQLEELDVDPQSTRLLWDGTKHPSVYENEERNNRLIYLARDAVNPDTTCLIVGNSEAAGFYAMSCSPGGEVYLGIGPEHYRFVANDILDTADDWEKLAPGLWRGLPQGS